MRWRRRSRNTRMESEEREKLITFLWAISKCPREEIERIVDETLRDEIEVLKSDLLQVEKELRRRKTL